MTRPAALLLLVALAACGERAAEPAAPGPPASGARAPAAAPLPAPGEVRVSRRGDRYTVLASEVPPRDALAELASAAGFEIERAAGDLPETPLRLELREASLERALSAILRGVTRQVHYEFADGDLSPERPFAGRPVVLARVTIGALPAPAVAERAEPVTPREPGKRARSEAAGESRPREEDGERARLRAEAEARDRERAAAVERDWRDPRAGVRLEAIERMEPALEDDRMRLAILLRDDPSAEVRATAAERLSEGNPFAVTDSLLAALEDADPDVVAGAVRGLEDVYAEAPNPRIRERVTALREHRDAEVREAVASFEEWLDE